MFTIIAAIGRNYELGKDNGLIWHIPADLKFFKEKTWGKTVVMGRKTFASLPKNLANRNIIVISTHSEEFSQIIQEINVTFVKTIQEVVDQYYGSEEEIFVAGGSSIYHQFMDYADKMYLTEIDATFSGADSFFPRFNLGEWDRKELYSEWENGLLYTFTEYTRNKIDKIME